MLKKIYKKNLQWGDVNKLVRGNKELAISGGPDILRAIYGIPYKSNKLKAVAGDGLVIFVKWDKNGRQTTKAYTNMEIVKIRNLLITTIKWSCLLKKDSKKHFF